MNGGAVANVSPTNHASTAFSPSAAAGAADLAIIAEHTNERAGSDRPTIRTGNANTGGRFTSPALVIPILATGSALPKTPSLWP